ncbi:TPA: hypothetical protein SML71_000975 [Serratia marcescens]|nr:hypothetical protein AM470_14440 [Serratia marcescens]MBH3237631.1 hypothetical protein [Serratia marcescens]HAT3852326.1 hypothetical protein [Serratia marcescens]HBH6865682.1 hypothetical protein [Serratia marcescens]HBL7110426.1 hypothetical protein [Serratia marcescens]
MLVRGDTVFVRFLAQNDDGSSFEVQTPTRPEERIRIGDGLTIGYKLPVNQKLLFSVAETLAQENHLQPEHKVDRFQNNCISMFSITIDHGKTIQDEVNEEWVTRFFELFDAHGISTNTGMVDIYSDLCVEDGEDVYLSDGMYMRPNGTIYER